jgi:hypothetical protein
MVRPGLEPFDHSLRQQYMIVISLSITHVTHAKAQP